MIVLALGCGLVASIGITQIVSKQNAEKPVPTGGTEGVFVTLQDIPLGEPLTSKLLGLEQWPKGKIPPGAFSKLEDIKDRRVRTRLYAGEPILESKLFAKGEKGGGVSPMIEKGFRVVSVKVDSVSSSGDLIRPGDRVDVLVHVRDGRVSPDGEPSTRTLLQHVKVFAVNDIVGSDSDDSIAAKTISLLVTPENAEKIMLASQLGQIQLVMRRPDDKEIVKTKGANIRGLFDDASASGSTSSSADDAQVDHREITAAPEEPPDVQGPEKTQAGQAPGGLADVSEPDAHKMRMMLGPVVNVFVLRPEDDLPKPVTEGGFWKITQEAEGGDSPGFAVTTPEPDDDAPVDAEPDSAGGL